MAVQIVRPMTRGIHQRSRKLKYAMSAKLAERHLPLEPVMRKPLRESVELEHIIAAMSIVALMPDNHWVFFEYRDFPNGLESVKAYAKETGRNLVTNTGISGDSYLAARADYLRRNPEPGTTDSFIDVVSGGPHYVTPQGL